LKIILLDTLIHSRVINHNYTLCHTQTLKTVAPHNVDSNRMWYGDSGGVWWIFQNYNVVYP